MNEPLSYRSRRFLIAVDVTVAGDSVRWCYRTYGDEWRQQLPLRVLIPYPTTTIDRSSLKFGIVTLVCLPVIGSVAFWALGISFIAVLLVVIVLVLGLFTTALAHNRGPVEWVTFNAYYPDKSVYLFRNRNDLGFDVFVEQLQAAIADAQRLNDDSRDSPGADG